MSALESTQVAMCLHRVGLEFAAHARMHVDISYRVGIAVSFVFTAIGGYLAPSFKRRDVFILINTIAELVCFWFYMTPYTIKGIVCDELPSNNCQVYQDKYENIGLGMVNLAMRLVEAAAGVWLALKLRRHGVGNDGVTLVVCLSAVLVAISLVGVGIFDLPAKTNLNWIQCFNKTLLLT